ncbi:MAG: bifunctional (p)ppGpp synthetase/guanosine-3',5'-bis(diphosphate) 3'-pyrophosphohydrolase [Microthrixaceae bacterium]|nr:bifunctional (p)ppGpp synthetase/guanosine-3',5'-bis(diphosphate) 3'-pyrophosphohydrolase [Microthrixaceae bacterium]
MATVTRVLPWRRHTQPPAMELEEILKQFRKFHPKESSAAISEAYRVAANAHKGQRRRSGEPYITHPLAVAAIVAAYGMDDVSICAALLHDAVEDTVITIDELTSQFGSEVAEIVDGVTKLERIHFDSKEAQQAATMRKMLVAMAKDLRVLVIKLADRLHNMRTIAAMPEFKQERTAQETLDIYAPLAHRLGMQEVKQQLEDLCFAALHPKRYAEVDHMVAERAPERAVYLKLVIDEVRATLAEANVSVEVTGRPKHLWSIYEKMIVKGKAFEDIYDLVGIRLVVGSLSDCYSALGSIHSLWTPVPGRIKDYIAMPKFNLYQSLHTTVIGPEGKPIEVQIRTSEMHFRAEWGVAAHFSYKETRGRNSNGKSTAGKGQSKPKDRSDEMPWLSRIVDWQEEMTDPGEFMANLKIDLDQDEVFIFTPNGDVVTLPAGATPVDFAYSIHTDVGHRCMGARVGGRLVPLDTKLQSGDTVEIFTSKVEGAGPSQDWLTFVATRSAASKIRHWFTRERREDATESGREALIRAMRREGLPVQQIQAGPVLAEVAEVLKFVNVEAMYVAMGEHHLAPEMVASRVAAMLRGVETGREEVVSSPTPTRNRRRGQPVGVNVEGYEAMLVHMARCCRPVPGDQIVGFVTRGRGVSVHRSDCSNAVSLVSGHGERMIDVSWDSGDKGEFIASVEVKALDRPRLLQDVTSILSENHVNIIDSTTRVGKDMVAKMQFEFELSDAAHLEVLLGRLRAVDSVYDAFRVLPGHSSG